MADGDTVGIQIQITAIKPIGSGTDWNDDRVRELARQHFAVGNHALDPLLVTSVEVELIDTAE